MTVDILFLAKNRLEFTVEAFYWLRQNTTWHDVRQLVLCDDGSEDGTLESLQFKAHLIPTDCVVRQTSFGGAIAAANDFILRSQADIVIKLDNDAVVPPGWLFAVTSIFEAHPELQILGLEERGYERPARPPFTYERSVHVGGLYAARRTIFRPNDMPEQNGTYHGWQSWHMNKQLRCGWIKPSIPVFLLDRLRFDPWASLSATYREKGWQRPWRQYPMHRQALWSWTGWPSRRESPNSLRLE